MKLKREFDIFSLTLYGIGIIVGAGIYSLIGVAAGLAQGLLWLAFIISAIIAFFTCLSYAELSSSISKDSAEYHYARKAFNNEVPAFIVGWTHAAANIFFASTVALAFAGYFSLITGLDYRIVASALLIVMGTVNYLGIKFSSFFNNFSAILSVIGLLIIAILAFLTPATQSVIPLSLPSTGVSGILSAVAIVFFAYIGFENVANIAEEVKDSRKTVPRAILLSLSVSVILYVLVSLASLRVVSWQALSASSSPLALVASKSILNASPLIVIIALFATSNAVLIALISASRVLYGMSSSKSLPSKFSDLSRRTTPWFSVIATAFIAIALCYFADLKTLAELTNMGIFLAYFAVNICLIILSRNSKKNKEGFKSPRIFGIPVLAWLGAACSLFMFAYIGLDLWVQFLGIIVAGLIVYAIFKFFSHPTEIQPNI